MAPPVFLISLSACCALVAHQVFRLHETYHVPFHLALLLGPPTAISGAAWALGSGAAGSIIPPWLLIYATYLATLIASVVIYRLSPFHPLAQVPGPLRFKVTKIWMATRCAMGMESQQITALHEEYGDIVRTGPNEISIRDPSLINALMGATGAPKGPNWLGFTLKYDDPPLIGIQDLKEHKRVRRPWNRGMTPSAVKEYEILMENRVNELVRSVDSRRGEIIVTQHIFGPFIHSSTVHRRLSDRIPSSFGEASRLTENKTFWSPIDDGAVPAAFLAHVPWLGFYVRLIPPVVAQVTGFMARCEALIEMRMARGSENPDLFYHLSDEDLGNAEPLPMNELVNHGILAVVAGTETTAIGLTCLFYGILTQPEIYAALEAEVDRFCHGSQAAVDTSHHHEMHYLEAVIAETMRLYNPAPNGSPRRVPQNGGGMYAGGVYLPPGTSFACHARSMQLDPRNFSFPDVFWPERWLVASGKLKSAKLPRSGLPGDVAQGVEYDAAMLAHNKMAYIPFSYGPMNCIGKDLSATVMRMVVCALLRQFKFELQEGWDARAWREGIRELGVTRCPPLPVIVKSRL
ncbi:high nitrogen upregulated cytochrome P450 monooxygenase 2 [Ganoderma leucocontextum]|nr:high nitrogen upregulated cytochrome P450 monooxygenase 2 [Ganoderma leucocontextum]